MKVIFRIIVIFTVLWAANCTENSQNVNLGGSWRGTITEKGRSTNVELSLRDQQGVIEGKLTILSFTGADVKKGKSFDIVNVERTGKILKFIVPVTGKVDDDAIAFELSVSGNRLEGHGREWRKGSKNIPVTFTKWGGAPTL